MPERQLKIVSVILRVRLFGDRLYRWRQPGLIDPYDLSRIRSYAGILIFRTCLALQKSPHRRWTLPKLHRSA